MDYFCSVVETSPTNCLYQGTSTLVCPLNSNLFEWEGPNFGLSKYLFFFKLIVDMKRLVSGTFRRDEKSLFLHVW